MMSFYEERFTPEAVDLYENWDPRSLEEHLKKWYCYDSSKAGFWAATLLMALLFLAWFFALYCLFVMWGV